MSTLTIPKKITRGAELVVLPRKEYEKLLTARIIPEYSPTAQEKRALARARKNRAAGNFFTLDELRKKLGFTD